MIQCLFSTQVIYRLLCVTLCTLLIGCGGAPLILKGRVINETGLALQGASVKTEPYTDSVSTNQQGQFFINRRLIDGGRQIKKLEAGAYHLIIDLTGYQTLKIPIKLGGDHKLPQEVYTLQRDRGDYDRQGPTKSGDKSKTVKHIHKGPMTGPP